MLISVLFFFSIYASCLCVFLQPPVPARRPVIRQAATWARTNQIQFVVQSSTASVVPSGDPGSAPSTSRDTKTTQPATHTQNAAPPGSPGLLEPQPGPSSSHTQSQPKLHTHIQHQDGTPACTEVEIHFVPSTSTNAKASATSSTHRLLNPQPGTSAPSQPHLPLERQTNVSAGATQYSATATASCSSAQTQERPSTSRPASDGAQASTSSANPQPGTSTQVQAIVLPRPSNMKGMNLVFLPQQPSVQASALISQPQLPQRLQRCVQVVSLNPRQGNLIQIEPQALAQAPTQLAVQPSQNPQVIPVVPPAVLVAAAPERLGPPEAGHRIILGSQVPAEPVPNPPAPNHNIRLPNGNANPPEPHNGGEAGLLPAPNPDQVNPAPVLVAVPPAPEDIPQIEDARPGPSAPQDRPDQRSLVRALITGVVRITNTVALWIFTT